MRPTILSSLLRLVAAALLSAGLAGCDKPPSPAPQRSGMPPSSKPVAKPAPTDPPTAQPDPALPLTIDEEPVATEASSIVTKRDETVSGKPACALDVRYRGAVDQPVVWNGEGCDAVTAVFVDAPTLGKLGRYDRLPEEVRDDMGRSGGTALYVEGGSTSSLYPLNSARRIYEVPLAD